VSPANICLALRNIQGGPAKSKQLPNYQNIVLIVLKSANEIIFVRQIKEMIKHYNITFSFF